MKKIVVKSTRKFIQTRKILVDIKADLFFLKEVKKDMYNIAFRR